MITEENQNKKVWFVTGASKGLGADLAQRLIAEGYKVAATSRNKQALIDLINTSIIDQYIYGLNFR